MMIRYLLLYMHSRATALIADLSSGVASFFLLALAVRSLILSAARFASVARLRALHLRALALRRSMMVAAASIAGCCRTKLGDGWSGDGMTNMMYGVWLGANV